MEKLLNDVCGFIDDEHKIFAASGMEKEYDALQFSPAFGNDEIFNNMDKPMTHSAPALRS